VNVELLLNVELILNVKEARCTPTRTHSTPHATHHSTPQSHSTPPSNSTIQTPTWTYFIRPWLLAINALAALVALACSY
jgi:hypothetical protein